MYLLFFLYGNWERNRTNAIQSSIHVNKNASRGNFLHWTLHSRLFHLHSFEIQRAYLYIRKRINWTNHSQIVQPIKHFSRQYSCDGYLIKTKTPIISCKLLCNSLLPPHNLCEMGRVANEPRKVLWGNIQSERGCEAVLMLYSQLIFRLYRKTNKRE